MTSDHYWVGYAITWILTFLGTWTWCTFTYGFLLGFGLGWLPAALLATCAALLWPLILLVVLILAAIALWGTQRVA